SGSSVSGNTAVNFGGGIWAIYSSLTVSGGSSVSGNTAGGGGGIGVGQAQVMVSGGSSVSGNTAFSGGGIYAHADSSVMVSGGSSVSGNTAGFGGGISALYYSDVTVSGSSVSGNTANDDGGGIWAVYSPVTVSGATLTSNSASSGGAIYGDGASPVSVFESCVVGNSDTAMSVMSWKSDKVEDNWWGHVSGPSGAGPGSGDSVSGGDFDPWAVTPFAWCPNTPPVADANGPYYVQFETDIVLDGSATFDLEGDADYLWSVTGGELDDPTLVSPTYTAPYELGIYTATLVVTDSFGSTHTATAEIEVYDPFVYSPWTGPGVRTDGVCQILMWWDTANVLLDTDADGVDEWSLRGAARFYDYDSDRGREISVTSQVGFDGDAGESVVLEHQWRTESWLQYVGLVRLDDVSLVVTERDGRAGDDKGTFAVSPEELIECGETVHMTLTIPVDPLGLRGRPSTDDTEGLVSVDVTITAVPMTYYPRR
ncbi:MAG: hypothetical protein HKO87_07875, partial [Acidimicrobiia bacterium]|nr:hypothetical protein [Acidimicrobiia bacterium]